MNEQEILDKLDELSETTYQNPDGTYYGGYGWDDDGGRVVSVQLLSKDDRVITNFFMVIGDNCEIKLFDWIQIDSHERDKEVELDDLPQCVIDTALEIARLAYF